MSQNSKKEEHMKRNFKVMMLSVICQASEHLCIMCITKTFFQDNQFRVGTILLNIYLEYMAEIKKIYKIRKWTSWYVGNVLKYLERRTQKKIWGYVICHLNKSVGRNSKLNPCIVCSIKTFFPDMQLRAVRYSQTCIKNLFRIHGYHKKNIYIK